MEPPLAKIGSHVKTNDAAQVPKLITHIMRLSGESRESPNQSENGLREPGKETTLGFVMEVREWGQGEWARACVVQLPSSTKEGVPRRTYPLAQIWIQRGRGRDKA